MAASAPLWWRAPRQPQQSEVSEGLCESLRKCLEMCGRMDGAEGVFDAGDGERPPVVHGAGRAVGRGHL